MNDESTTEDSREADDPQRTDLESLMQAKKIIADLGEEIKTQEALIERQGRELEKLRRHRANEQYAEELRDALTLSMVAGNITAPVSHHRLLEMIVETAAHVIQAKAAALFLFDDSTQELTFEVALGGGGQQLKKFRVPLGKGVAGYVAESQQPLAITDVASSTLWHREIGDAVGYVPRNILCVPMFKGTQLSGVLEMCDKIGADSFSLADIETLGMFGNQAAVAIELSRTHYNVAALIREILDTSPGITDGQREKLKRQAYEFAGSMDESEEYRRRFDLARLVQAIVWQGENEFRACQTILRGFSDYLAEQPFGQGREMGQ
jgi:GAF domain-containing protein